VLRLNRDGSPARTAAARLIGIVILQISAGAMNLSLLAPTWMQLIHLLIADLVWIAMILLALETVGLVSGSITRPLCQPKNATSLVHDPCGDRERRAARIPSPYRYAVASSLQPIALGLSSSPAMSARERCAGRFAREYSEGVFRACQR